MNGDSTVYYNYKYAGKVINALFYEELLPEEYMKLNGIDKTGWHDGTGTVSSTPAASSGTPSKTSSASPSHASSSSPTSSSAQSSSAASSAESKPDTSSKKRLQRSPMNRKIRQHLQSRTDRIHRLSLQRPSREYSFAFMAAKPLSLNKKYRLEHFVSADLLYNLF